MRQCVSNQHFVPALKLIFCKCRQDEKIILNHSLIAKLPSVVTGEPTTTSYDYVGTVSADTTPTFTTDVTTYTRGMLLNIPPISFRAGYWQVYQSNTEFIINFIEKCVHYEFVPITGVMPRIWRFSNSSESPYSKQCPIKKGLFVMIHFHRS